MRYGERTARGIAGGTNVTWALTLWERRRARSDKKKMVSCDTMNDIGLFRLPVTSTPDKKTKERKDWPLAEWKRMAEGIWAKDEKSWEATKVTRPQCKTSHDAVT